MSSSWGQGNDEKEDIGWTFGGSSYDPSTAWGQAPLQSSSAPHIGWGLEPVPPASFTSSNWFPIRSATEPSYNQDPIHSSRRSSASSHTPDQQHNPITVAISSNAYDPGRAASVTPTELSSTTSAPRLNRPHNHAQAFKMMTKYIQQGVRQQIELDKTTAEIERWRRTRASEEYSHATPVTRNKLDTIRAELGRKQGDAQKRLRSTIASLAELPYISATQLQGAQYAVNESELIRYLNQLKDWIQEAYKHPFLQPKGPEPLAPPKEPESEDADVTPTSVFIQDPKTWSWNDMKTALRELEDRVAMVTEQIYPDRRIQLSAEFCAEVESKQQNLVTGAEQLLNTDLARVEDKSQGVGDTIANHSERVAALLREKAQLQAQLATLTEQLVEIQGILDRLKNGVKESEHFLRQSEDKVEHLRQQTQQILLRQSFPSPPDQKIVDELLPHIRDQTISQLRVEVLPILDSLKAECLRQDANLQQVINDTVQLIIDKTKAIIDYAPQIFLK